MCFVVYDEFIKNIYYFMLKDVGKKQNFNKISLKDSLDIVLTFLDSPHYFDSNSYTLPFTNSSKFLKILITSRPLSFFWRKYLVS